MKGSFLQNVFVSRTNEISKDYEYPDDSSIDADLKCAICDDPFEQPVSTPCDHTFCLTCIEQWMQTNKSCPTCRHRISKNKELKPVKMHLVLSMLDRLPVKCKLCGQQGIQRGNFKDHIQKTCQKTKECPCSASDIRCPWVGRRDQLSNHLVQCPYEQIRPVLSEVLKENRQSKQRIDQLTGQYEKLYYEKQNQTEIDELRSVNQRLNEQIRYLQQKCQQLESAEKKKPPHKQIEHVQRAPEDTRASTTVTLLSIRTVTFDSLLSVRGSDSIPNGYAGLKWVNARYTNEQNARMLRSSTSRERVNAFLHGHSSVAFNDYGNPMLICTMKSGSETFSIVACEITSVNHQEDHLKLNIIARRSKKPIYSKVINLKRDVLRVIEFDSWINIDELEFSVVNSYIALTWLQFV